ncbi:ras guanine nucleotide exchange factor domain-containing protein [Gongronella butleri]|nr:ras guanine nucleotide exchange factor domain-containing protein [Gongronella butleri]
MRRHPSLANLRKTAQGRDHDDEPPTPCARATPFSDLMLATKSGEGSILHLSENGHDVLLMERIDGRFQVLAGTTEKLFLKLADETVQDFDYVDAYILNHTEFTTSDEFLENLMSRFYLEPLPGELAYFYKWQHNIQTKVLHVISRWIKLQFIDFINNPVLLTRLRAFVTGDVTRGGFAAEARSIRDLLDSQDAQHDQPRHVIIQALANVNVRQHAPVIASHCAQPLSPSMALVPAILAMAPKEIAQYLTLADFYLLKCITPFDLLEHVRKHKHQQPRCHGDYIERLTRRANQLSHWVQQMIQLQPSSRHRRLVLRKIIDVAKHCLEFHNFHTSMLLTTSLLQPAIQKLTEWSGVSGHEDVASLMRLLDVSNNMYAYRGALAQAKAPLVPFFPLLLKDLTFIMDGNAPVYQEDTSNAAPGPLTATNASMAPSSSPAAAQASSSSFSGAASAVTGLGGDTSACATNGCHDDLINFSKYRTLTHCLHGVLRATYDDYAFSSQLGDWAFLTPNQPRLHTLPDHAYPLDHVAWLMEQSLWASSPASSSSSSSSSPSSSTPS